MGEGSKKVSEYNVSGKFADNILESDYQNYVKREIKEGKTPRDRLDWKEARNFWNSDSPIARGNRFNQKAVREGRYPYSEIHLRNGKRLDSFDPFSGEIISRKATGLDNTTDETYRRYLSEFESKYSKGTVIRSDKYSELDGTPLEGKYILEIPASNQILKNIDYFRKIAKEYDVELRLFEE
ncbi:hypothetical protein K6959_03890 [Bacillus aquiflavi]|uniref:hypothetical protein n=1 Tax=Bacillus aquiflavi TaxID=2672567 RepID=UPI001CAA2277|nr:hypothetical protein [Bacillus aquiflavi]UAC49052.1 hypothetical protein K6959_03890 [Bacillus aquiflavi]